MSLIRLAHVKKSYYPAHMRHAPSGTPVVHALRGLNLDVEEGEMLAIMGKSGSGKSTLLNILGALDHPDEGEYRFRGKLQNLTGSSRSAAFRRNHIGFIVQDFALIEQLSVFNNIALPLRQRRMKQTAIRQLVEDILLEVGIPDKSSRTPLELSGGEQQRVAIARAVVHEPDLILTDEPTGALDQDTEADILDLFKKLHAKGKTIILVTHDDQVASTCDRTVLLIDGCIPEEMPNGGSRL